MKPKKPYEKFVEITFTFNMGWCIDDFDNSEWPGDKELFDSTIENIKYNYFNKDGHEANAKVNAKMLDGLSNPENRESEMNP